jgi:hypothetical protein
VPRGNGERFNEPVGLQCRSFGPLMAGTEELSGSF